MKDKNNREDFLVKLKAFGVENDIPNISFINARFLRDIIKLKKPTKILEVGTANGFSTINMAIETENYGGSIDTIEFSDRSFNLAKSNIEEVGLQNSVHQYLGNALDIIPTLEVGYEMIFIDGMKRRTKDFFELSFPLLKQGGVMIIDDVILFREKMENFYDLLEKEKITYNIIPIDVNDGVMMIIK